MRFRETLSAIRSEDEQHALRDAKVRRLGLEPSTLGLKVAAKVSGRCYRVHVCPGQSTFYVQPVLARPGRYEPVRETIRETLGRREPERDSSSLSHGLRIRSSSSDFLCPKVQNLAAT